MTRDEATQLLNWANKLTPVPDTRDSLAQRVSVVRRTLRQYLRSWEPANRISDAADRADNGWMLYSHDAPGIREKVWLAVRAELELILEPILKTEPVTA